MPQKRKHLWETKAPKCYKLDHLSVVVSAATEEVAIKRARKYFWDERLDWYEVKKLQGKIKAEPIVCSVSGCQDYALNPHSDRYSRDWWLGSGASHYCKRHAEFIRLPNEQKLVYLFDQIQKIRESLK